jgi:hypothetical protein
VTTTELIAAVGRAGGLEILQRGAAPTLVEQAWMSSSTRVWRRLASTSFSPLPQSAESDTALATARARLVQLSDSDPIPRR